MDVKSTFEYSRSAERENQTQANSLATRVSTWILAGHGAALLLCFNAVVARQICHWPAIRPLALMFLIGLVTAFLAVVFRMHLFDLNSARLMKINAAATVAFSHVDAIDQLNNAQSEVNEEQVGAIANVESNNQSNANTKIEKMNRLANVPKWERLLWCASECFLIISALVFVLSLFVAIWSDQLIGALCPSGL